ncbi:MAG: hypothetical protein GY842_28475 [bacterium]|nr:hypothetical protein [bacterium]
MSLQRTILYTILFTIPAAGVLGCVKRSERIRVTPDGAVAILVEYTEADSLAELRDGDAAPSVKDGWKVKEWSEDEGEDNEKYYLTAEKQFPRGASLPDTFAGSSADADLYLQFPTTLTIEQRTDGTYYHLRRVYPPRLHWASLGAFSEARLKEPEKRLEGKEELSQQDWRVLLGALVDIELNKMTTFGRAAFLDVSPDMPQDGWLHAHTALHSITNELDGERVAKLLADSDEAERERALEAEAEAFEARTLELMTAALREFAGYDDAQISRFVERFEWYGRHFEISEDLSDESFKLRVDMPGEIVASNAREIDGQRAKWKFDGTAIRDGGLEVMVTSRVKR